LYKTNKLDFVSIKINDNYICSKSGYDKKEFFLNENNKNNKNNKNYGVYFLENNETIHITEYKDNKHYEGTYFFDTKMSCENELINLNKSKLELLNKFLNKFNTS
jgi:hypothetical protein